MASRLRRIAVASLLAAGCAASTAEPRCAAPNAVPKQDDRVTRACASQYAEIESNWATYAPPKDATSPFRHCPRWRMAAPEACGASVQPSFFDPCHCMCDLCETDADCARGASCVAMSSVICGGLEERVCVAETDPCHPKNAKACSTYCVTLFGSPRCVAKADLALCHR